MIVEHKIRQNHNNAHLSHVPALGRQINHEALAIRDNK